MSTTPTPIDVTMEARWATGRAPEPSASTRSIGTDARRAATSGHMPELASVRSRAMNSNPKQAPTPMASATIRGGVLCECVPSAPLTRAMATTARAMPA